MKGKKGCFQTVFIGIGETDDPLPEERKPTLFWVFAGACPGCGSATRFLLPGSEIFFIECRACQSRQEVGLVSALAPQVTYVHWCRDARFPSDTVSLSREALEGIEACIRKLGGEVESPAWGVKIVGMKCEHAVRCIAPGCPYRISVEAKEKKVIDLAKRRARRGT